MPAARSLRSLIGVLLCVASLAGLGGCGRFAAADRRVAPETGMDAPSTSSTTTPTSLPEPTSVPATDAAPPTSAAPAPVTPAAGGEPEVLNAASATTDGLEVEVVAEGGPHYPSLPHFGIQVTLRNVGDRTRHYFLGQGNYAVLTDGTGSVVWTSGDCNPTLDTYEIQGGAAAIEPGEEVPVIVDYPQPDVERDVGCDLPDGHYTLHGLFPICPPDQVRETANPGTYRCPEESIETYASAGLAITIGDP